MGFAWRDRDVTLVAPAHTLTLTVGAGLRGTATHLTDGRQHTVVLGERERRSRFTLDLGRERMVCGFELLPADAPSLSLPTHSEVALSRDGETWRKVIPWRMRLPVAYAAGAGVYLGGGQGRTEFAFPPQPARYVRFTGASPEGRLLDIPLGEGRRGPAEWRAAEVRVYESTGARPGATEQEAREIAGYLAEMGVGFTACDRWLSARLLARQPAGAAPCAFPLFEYPGHLQGDGGAAPFWRFKPAAQTALIVALAHAGEQASLLRQALGRGSPWLFSEHGAYASFVFLPSLPPNPPALVWDGARLIFE